MARPNKKRASKAARKPVDVVKAAPTTEELQAEVSKFDHDGDGHVGGSLPHAHEPAAAADDGAPEPEAKADVPNALETGARSQTVSLGPVECRMRRVPVETVCGLLTPEGVRRVDAYIESGTLEETRKRLLVSDGLAAPVIFEAPSLAGADPTLLHGYEEIAAAKAGGVNDLVVVLVPSGGASVAQSHIVEMVRQQRQKAPADDEELLYRLHAED